LHHALSSKIATCSIKFRRLQSQQPVIFSWVAHAALRCHLRAGGHPLEMYGANMAFSLKMRAPFFVHRIFELAWKVPYGVKHIDRLCKQPLRQILYR